MTTTIKIQDLAISRELDQRALRDVRGGAVATGFLFRSPARQASPGTPVLNQIFNIDDINVSNTYIDTLVQQTNNLSQINVTDIIAIDSFVSAGVNQGQLGINS